MQIWAESGKSALPICNYSQILYQFLTFTQNLKRSRKVHEYSYKLLPKCAFLLPFAAICAVLIFLYVSVISVQEMQILAKYCKMCTAIVVET